jgi:hypothetical protein
MGREQEQMDSVMWASLHEMPTPQNSSVSTSCMPPQSWPAYQGVARPYLRRRRRQAGLRNLEPLPLEMKRRCTPDPSSAAVFDPYRHCPSAVEKVPVAAQGGEEAHSAAGRRSRAPCRLNALAGVPSPCRSSSTSCASPPSLVRPPRNPS